VFVEPRLVAEVEFAEWTSAGNIRHPSYKGLREDKDPTSVVREDPRAGPPAAHATASGAKRRSKSSGSGRTVAKRPAGAPAAIVPEGQDSAVIELDGHELKLSNLQKVLYPEAGFTKGELIEYYASIAPVLLPHLAGRALTVTRWPDGVESKSFFQKQSPAHRPDWVRTATLPAGSKKIDYTLAEDLPTLLWLANLAAIELHTPLALATAIDRPTSMVFDLDPGEPADVIDCARLALQLQGMFENLGLQSLAKTSGSKGLQVYVPLNVEDVDFERTKAFARAVAELFEQNDPDHVISRQTRARRGGKVLIDWSQNDRNKTTVCVYSLRARPRPTVSTPVEWDEVRAAAEQRDPRLLTFEASDVLARAAERGDLFAPLLSTSQKLPDFAPGG
jgi:bifunctional non-homologous end joining protein LigD